jgi:hypothetical protein
MLTNKHVNTLVDQPHSRPIALFLISKETSYGKHGCCTNSCWNTLPVIEAGSGDGLLTLRPEELGEVLVGVVHLVVELQVGQPQVHRQRYRLKAPEEHRHL